MKHLIFYVALVFFFCSCATAYQPMGFKGGYKEIQLQDDVFKVTFSGNGYTSAERVNNYLLYRCAEITVQNSCDYFEIIGDESYTKESSYTNVQVDSWGNTATGTAQTNRISKRSGVYVIRIGKGSKPENSKNVYDAHQLIKYLKVK